MPYRKPEVKEVEKKKPIVIEVEATDEVKADYQGKDDGIVTNPKIG